MHPINSNKTRNTQNPRIRATDKLLKTCSATIMHAIPITAFCARIPLMNVY